MGKTDVLYHDIAGICKGKGYANKVNPPLLGDLPAPKNYTTILYQFKIL